MKINSVAALHTYNKINEHTSVVHHAENSIGDSERKCENTDQIQISLEGTRKVEVEQLTRAISAEMHQNGWRNCAKRYKKKIIMYRREIWLMR